MIDSGTAQRRLRGLFVSADVPWPPDGGGRIATLRVLEALARFADIDLIALADPVRELDPDRLGNLCRSVTVVPHPFTFGQHRVRQTLVALGSLLSPAPYRLRKFQSRALRRELARLTALGPYDFVHYDQFGVAPYVDPRFPSTLVTQNVESDIYRLGTRTARDPLRRTWAKLEERKLRRSESTLLRRYDEVFVLAPDDAALLAKMGIERVTVLPMPGPGVYPERPVPASRSILSLGSMSWFGVEDGLLWFHREVLPLVRVRVPDVTWRLVGPNAGPAIRRLSEEPAIEVVGYVDQVDDVVRAHRVGIVPLRIAGGIRMKLIDLMSWGLPSVSTTLGARGLAFADGAGCLVRDDPAAFADAVVELLVDDTRWLEVAKDGRDYVLRHHSADRTADVMAAGVGRAIARHAAANTAVIDA